MSLACLSLDKMSLTNFAREAIFDLIPSLFCNHIRPTGWLLPTELVVGL